MNRLMKKGDGSFPGVVSGGVVVRRGLQMVTGMQQPRPDHRSDSGGWIRDTNVL